MYVVNYQQVLKLTYAFDNNSHKNMVVNNTVQVYINFFIKSAQFCRA